MSRKEPKSVVLKLTSAIAMDGSIAKAGELIEVEMNVAKNLLHRGKAVVATEADGAPTADEADDEGEGEGEGGLGRMNKAQLVELAKAKGIEPGDMTKAELKAAIEQAEAGE